MKSSPKLSERREEAKVMVEKALTLEKGGMQKPEAKEGESKAELLMQEREEAKEATERKVSKENAGSAENLATVSGIAQSQSLKAKGKNHSQGIVTPADSGAIEQGIAPKV